MKVWRIKFKGSHDYTIDVVAEKITDACVLAVNYYTKDGTSLSVEDIISAELLSQPIESSKKWIVHNANWLCLILSKIQFLSLINWLWQWCSQNIASQSPHLLSKQAFDHLDLNLSSFILTTHNIPHRLKKHKQYHYSILDTKHLHLIYYHSHSCFGTFGSWKFSCRYSACFKQQTINLHCGQFIFCYPV